MRRWTGNHTFIPVMRALECSPVQCHLPPPFMTFVEQVGNECMRCSQPELIAVDFFGLQLSEPLQSALLVYMEKFVKITIFVKVEVEVSLQCEN